VSSPLAGVDPRWLLYGAAVVAVGYVAWKVSKAAGAGADAARNVAENVAQAARSTVAAINPADERNLANRAVNAAGSAVTGDDSWSLGGQLAEWFSPSVRKANEMLRAPSTPIGSRSDFRRSELLEQREPVWNYADDPAATYTLGASA
jgi:pyruvate/2-oxoglutarate dehydrogenase complex dihydrolipoamide acyltransferase (E2) component